MWTRSSFKAAFAAAVLAFAGAGWAQDGESNGASGALFSLFQEVQALQEEVRQLRGEVEELRHSVEQGEQRQRDLYRDLDERLQALEQTADKSEDAGTATSEDDASVPVDEGAVEQAYLDAFDLLKAGEYEPARKAFQAFVERFSSSDYTDNAWYWLGEAHYVDRQYQPALTAFRRVIEDFPDSAKTPGAMYKTGVILDEQGEYDQARAQLRQVIEQYPEDDVVDLARERLQAIDGGREEDDGGN